MRVDTEVMAVLDRGRAEGSAFYLAQERLDSKLYERTNKVLELAGGKWNRGKQAHVFAGSAEEALEPLLLTGEIADTKRDFQVFETPEGLAADVVRRADIKPGMYVLEPSAGSGRLAWSAACAGGRVTAVEVRKEALSALQSAALDSVFIADFLAHDRLPYRHFDRVVMNPPFAKGQDARHVTHALRFLKPSGRLVAIMGAGASTKTTGAYRDLHAALRGFKHHFEPLAADAFRESGTLVRTVLLIADAPAATAPSAEAA